MSSHGQLDFKENTRLEKSARDQAAAADRTSINEFDEQFKALSDDELRAKTAAWKAELAAIEDPEVLGRGSRRFCPKPLRW